MPDCSIDIDERFNLKGYRSLHTLLENYMTYDCTNFIPSYLTVDQFDFINIDIPVPFKTGDIVHIKHQNDNIFVYDKRNYEDNKYISTTCYFADCGRISHCYMHAAEHVMNMEYFDKGIPSNKNTLHTLSRYLKKEIPLDYLLNNYLLNAFEDITDNLKNERNLFHISEFPYDEDLPF